MPAFPVSYIILTCLGFGTKDFHLPVSGFLLAFITILHTSILRRLWKPIATSSVDFPCCCFRNMGVFSGMEL